MLSGVTDDKGENHNVQEGLVGNRHSLLSIVIGDLKFHLVGAFGYVLSLHDGMVEQRS